MRLDVFLTENGLAPTRTRAQSLVKGELVSVDGMIVTKPSFPVEPGQDVRVLGEIHPYVGRGGLKLAGALEAFSIDVRGMIAADIGASTGGFTDCLLQNGAKTVFAIDAGSGQLDARLRTDPRVINIENFNARNLHLQTIGTLCDIVVADLSFISQSYVLSGIAEILRDGGVYIGLIKPQFECGRTALDRHGMVRDRRLHAQAIARVIASAAEYGLNSIALIVSPITGGDGNREYLYYARKGGEDILSPITHEDIMKVVNS